MDWFMASFIKLWPWQPNFSLSTWNHPLYQENLFFFWLLKIWGQMNKALEKKTFEGRYGQLKMKEKLT